MSGVLGALAGVGAIVGPVARAVEAIAGLFGRAQVRAAEVDQRTAGATAAENETMIDTAEVSDAQAANNLQRRTPRDIARRLRREADDADGGGDGAKPC